MDKSINNKKLDKEAEEVVLRTKRKDFEMLEEKADSIRDDLLKRTEEISSLANKEEVNKERRASLLKDKERLEAELSTLETKLLREQTNAEALENARKSVDEESARCKEALEQKRAATVEIESLLEQKEALIEENKNLIFEYSGEVSSKKSEIDSILN